MREHAAQRLSFTADRKHTTWQWHSISLVVILLASLACFGAYRFLQGEENQPGLLYTPLEPRFLGRNYKIRMLEQQLLDKENEIRYLHYAIDKARMASKLKGTNLEAADATIKTLQDRSDQENAVRGRAQLELADKASELTVCQNQRDALAAESQRCSEEMRSLTHAHKRVLAGGSLS